MIVPGNAKLGRAVWSFGLAAVATCPGATALCMKHCYARGGLFSLPSVRDNRRRCYEASQRKTFAKEMTALIRTNFVELMRCHVEGDFYDAAYIGKWAKVAAACRKTTFLAYTRSWRVPGLIPALSELGSLPNVRLWFSADAETGQPPRVAGVRGVAYMSLSDADLPGYQADVVFRDRSATLMKYTPDGDLVCPYEQGVRPKTKITCSACRYCFSSETRTRREGKGRVPLEVVA